MSNQPIPKAAFPNMNDRFNDAKARAHDYASKIQTHIDRQQNRCPGFNGYPAREESKKLTEMEELANVLQDIYDRFCMLPEMW